MKKKGPKYKQIIDAAVTVIAENGYHAAQVSKIAKQAGVADGTIYLYFANKEDLLISLFQEKMGEFIKKTDVELKEIASIEKKLFVLIERHFQLLATSEHLAIVTQLELRQANKHLRESIAKVLKPYFAILQSILTEGKGIGLIPQQLDVRLASQMIFGSVDETITTWVINNQKYDLVALAKPLHHMLFNGLRTEEKHN
jgi:TetR/AcrR family transcriptional regulator, fatty acid metabolism regulator protein